MSLLALAEPAWGLSFKGSVLVPSSLICTPNQCWHRPCLLSAPQDTPVTYTSCCQHPWTCWQTEAESCSSRPASPLLHLASPLCLVSAAWRAHAICLALLVCPGRSCAPSSRWLSRTSPFHALWTQGCFAAVSFCGCCCHPDPADPTLPSPSQMTAPRLPVQQPWSRVM